MLLKKLKIAFPFAPVLWCDNLSALALASKPIFHARTKHIEAEYHFVRNKVVHGDIITSLSLPSLKLLIYLLRVTPMPVFFNYVTN